MTGTDGRPCDSRISLPEGFWDTVKSSARTLLVLDYDGTLAPFRISRDDSRLTPDLLALIQSIASGSSTVSVLSGRPLGELIQFLEGLPVHLVGEHGWDTRAADGRMVRYPIPEKTAEALGWAASTARAAGLGLHLEIKRTAVVLHTRGLPEPEALELQRRCRLLWETAPVVAPLRLSPMDGGLELRAAGRDKGLALRELIESAEEGSLPVFLGDDLADEDAFREVVTRGFGIRVGPTARPSLASGRIETCDAIVDFLGCWRSARHDGVPKGAPARPEVPP